MLSGFPVSYLAILIYESGDFPQVARIVLALFAVTLWLVLIGISFAYAKPYFFLALIGAGAALSYFAPKDPPTVAMCLMKPLLPLERHLKRVNDASACQSPLSPK